jgi:hypothetical protein
MKAKILAAGLIVILTAALCFITGCATTDYYRLGQTRDDIDWKMTWYRNEAAFGAIGPSFQPEVNAAYQTGEQQLQRPDAGERQATGRPIAHHSRRNPRRSVTGKVCGLVLRIKFRWRFAGGEVI